MAMRGDASTLDAYDMAVFDMHMATAVEVSVTPVDHHEVDEFRG